MTPALLLIGLSGVIVAGLVWWLLWETEGVYLGRGVVIWLYDRFARRYDQIKGFHPEYEHWLLSRPIMAAIAPQTDPFVLDVATGTGRLPLVLCDDAHFEGRVIGIDLSRAMLRQAAHKLKLDRERVDLLWCPADDLPFPDDVFDVVTCLEALEFMPDQAAVLAECVRVLRPGGLLLLTNRINTRWMPGRLWDDHALLRQLAELGITDAEVELWQMDYKKVWGVKIGDRPLTGARPLADVLRCPRCIESPMERDDDGWRCGDCGGRAAVRDDGVVELWPLYPA